MKDLRPKTYSKKERNAIYHKAMALLHKDFRRFMKERHATDALSRLTLNEPIGLCWAIEKATNPYLKSLGEDVSFAFDSFQEYELVRPPGALRTNNYWFHHVRDAEGYTTYEEAYEMRQTILCLLIAKTES